MKNFILLVMLLIFSAAAGARTKVVPTTFIMLCYIASQDDNWTYRDFGFTATYKNAQGKTQTLQAKTASTQKNCTTKMVTASGVIPAGVITFHIEDFVGEAGSTVECTNPITYKLTHQQIGKTCEFIVKSPKYGSYTTTDECALLVDCNSTALSAKIPTQVTKK